MPGTAQRSSLGRGTRQKKVIHKLIQQRTRTDSIGMQKPPVKHIQPPAMRVAVRADGNAASILKTISLPQEHLAGASSAIPLRILVLLGPLLLLAVVRVVVRLALLLRRLLLWWRGRRGGRRTELRLVVDWGWRRRERRSARRGWWRSLIRPISRLRRRRRRV